MTWGPGRSMRELIESGERSFSFEFFPPKDEAGEEQLWRAITELEAIPEGSFAAAIDHLPRLRDLGVPVPSLAAG